MTCKAKRSAYQPTDDEWRCPKCGSDVSFEIIETAGDCDDDECTLLHDEDECECSACHYYATGAQVSLHFRKARGLIRCPACKGTGVVEGTTRQG